MAGDRFGTLVRVWTTLRQLPRVRAWLAGWAMVVLLVAAGVVLVRPLPNTLEARGMRISSDVLREMRPSREQDAEFPGGSTLPPDTTIAILFESIVRTAQGPPSRPWELMRYRRVEDGAGAHRVEATLVTMDWWGRSASEGESRYRALLTDKTIVYRVDPTSRGVVGIEVPEGDAWVASLALQAAVLEPSGLLPPRVLTRGDRWWRASVGRVEGVPDARFDLRGEFTFEGFINWRGVDLAHVRGEIGGTADGLFLPDLVGNPTGTGTLLVSRRIESVAHYFLDPQTGALVGGFHLTSPVSEVQARIERDPNVDELVEQPYTRRDYEVQTSFTVVNEAQFLQRR